jgi:hypothetical protein
MVRHKAAGAGRRPWRSLGLTVFCVAVVACVDQGAITAFSANPTHLASDSVPGDTTPPDTTPPDTTPPDTNPPPPPDTSTTGMIHGVVLLVDSTVQPPQIRGLAGALVTARQERDSTRVDRSPYRSRTDSGGYYRLAGLPKGRYEMRVTPRRGFRPQTRDNVPTGPNDPAVTPFTTFIFHRNR